jgi:hypothetical protein
MVGDQSYYEANFDTTASYQHGFTEFSPKSPILWHPEDNILELDHSKEDLLHHELKDGDTSETNIDGIAQYAIAFWFKYLTTYPKRLLSKPAWLQLARFSSTPEV